MLAEESVTTPRPASNKPLARLTGWLKLSYQTNRPLTFLGILMAIMLAACAFGLAFDHRIINGAAAWAKPTKFALSIGFYAFTLSWILSYVNGHPRLVGLISWVTNLAFLVEVVLILVQVVRGVGSHFNVSTDFDASLFSLMGNVIVTVWLMNLLAIILVIFKKFPDPTLGWSLRFALITTLLGSALGILMIMQASPTEAALRAAHEHSPVHGAHSIGVDDGGPGLPLLGWSTTGGDLRIAHFLGLHSLQVIPLMGWLVMKLDRRRYRSGHRVALVGIGALGYLGLVGLVAWQALRGQPLLSPDALTLEVFGGLVAATLVLAGGVAWHAGRTFRQAVALTVRES
ncbi:MAG TPA: hypothetical protein VH186_33770 [Chloroflexia bacterium]|nr:hypothetical protein [Chloroflexia bacterium]